MGKIYLYIFDFQILLIKSSIKNSVDFYYVLSLFTIKNFRVHTHMTRSGLRSQSWSFLVEQEPELFLKFSRSRSWWLI